MDAKPQVPASSKKRILGAFIASFNHHYPPEFIRKVVAEVIATFLLVFVTCGAAAISESDEHRIAKLAASMAGGMIVTVMIFAVGHISGAHMNPAVTLAFAAVRHFPWKQVPVYAAAQVTGATAAGFTLKTLLKPIRMLGTTAPSDWRVSWLGSWLFCLHYFYLGWASIRRINEPSKNIGPSLSQWILQRVMGIFCGPTIGHIIRSVVLQFHQVSRK